LTQSLSLPFKQLARTQRGLHSEKRSIVQEQINLKKKEYQIAKI